MSGIDPNVPLSPHCPTGPEGTGGSGGSMGGTGGSTDSISGTPPLDFNLSLNCLEGPRISLLEFTQTFSDRVELRNILRESQLINGIDVRKFIAALNEGINAIFDLINLAEGQITEHKDIVNSYNTAIANITSEIDAHNAGVPQETTQTNTLNNAIATYNASGKTQQDIDDFNDVANTYNQFATTRNQVIDDFNQQTVDDFNAKVTALNARITELNDVRTEMGLSPLPLLPSLQSAQSMPSQELAPCTSCGPSGNFTPKPSRDVVSTPTELAPPPDSEQAILTDLSVLIDLLLQNPGVGQEEVIRENILTELFALLAGGDDITIPNEFVRTRSKSFSGIGQGTSAMLIGQSLSSVATPRIISTALHQTDNRDFLVELGRRLHTSASILLSNASLLSARDAIAFLGPLFGRVPLNGSSIQSVLALTLANRAIDLTELGITGESLKALLPEGLDGNEEIQKALFNLSITLFSVAQIAFALKAPGLVPQVASLLGTPLTPNELAAGDILFNPLQIVELQAELADIIKENSILADSVDRAIADIIRQNSVKSAEDIKNQLIDSLREQRIKEEVIAAIANRVEQFVETAITIPYLDLLIVREHVEQIVERQLEAISTNPQVNPAIKELLDTGDFETIRDFRSSLITSLVARGIQEKEAIKIANALAKRIQDDTLSSQENPILNLLAKETLTLDALKEEIISRTIDLIGDEVDLDKAEEIGSQIAQTIVRAKEAIEKEINSLGDISEERRSELLRESFERFQTPTIQLIQFNQQIKTPAFQIMEIPYTMTQGMDQPYKKSIDIPV